ncbi:MAG: rod shape-determining protein MreD [Paludibacteraceae bacterium]|nr:rod shape-determining protein MreD [Paludibacteraceae bacterium]
MNIVAKNILRLVIVVLLQVLVVNNIALLSFCDPLIYIYFLFLLPLSLPRWAELLIGFSAGLVMDIFCNSLGLHAAACTLFSYLRPIVVSTLVSDYERITGEPGFSTFGPAAFVKYTVILTLVHHCAYFLLESFSFAHIGWLLLRIVTSSLFSIVVVLTAVLIRERK